MNEGMREDAILWEGKPEGAGPFSGGSLTVMPFQIGIVIRDGEVVDVFESGKRNLPRRGEVRTYVASTAPFNLTFDLKDPFGASAHGRGAVLDQLVLTEDREVVTGSIDLTLRVVRENVEHLLKLLAPGSDIVTQQHVSDRIKTELQAKVLALDVSKFTAEELLGNEDLFRNMYKSVEVHMKSSIRFYGLRLDNFYPNWGVTHEDLKKIMQQAQELDEIAAATVPHTIEEGGGTVEKPSDGIGGGWEEIGHSFKNGRKSMENVSDWVKGRIPKYRRMFHTTDRHSSEKSYYLNGKTFTYRISFSRVHGGTDLRVCKTLKEQSAGNFSSAGNEPSPEVPPLGHGGQANASYYTPPPQAGTFAPGRSIEHEAESPVGMAEVSDFEQESSGPSVTVVVVGVLIASALLVAAFFLAPEIFAGVFVLGLAIVLGGAYMGKDTVRNVGIVVLVAGIVGMVCTAVFRTG